MYLLRCLQSGLPLAPATSGSRAGVYKMGDQNTPDSPKLTYVVCAWCETDYNAGKREDIGYRTGDSWTYRKTPIHTESETTHSVCPTHSSEALKKWRLSFNPKPGDEK